MERLAKKMIFQQNIDEISILAGKCTFSTQELENQVRLELHEKGFYAAIQSETRRREWLWIRYLLQKNGQNLSIRYDVFGKPFLENSAQSIAISHTQHMGAVALSERAQLGIDIEHRERQVTHLARKFASPHELQIAESWGSRNNDFLLAVWRTKEAIYKAVNAIGIDFRTGIEVAEVQTEDQFLVRLRYKNLPSDWIVRHQTIEDHILTWTSL